MANKVATRLDGKPHLSHAPNKIKSAWEVDSTPPKMSRTQQVKTWSPWGGKKAFGYMDEKEEVTIWYCQVCGKEQPKEMDAHRLEISLSCSLRICSVCKHLMVKCKLNYQQLISRVRGKYA